MGSRLTGEAEAKVYEAVEHWKQAALLSDGSLFTPDKGIWTPPLLAELRKYVLNRPDQGGNSFWGKLRAQLDGCSLEAYQLMAEILYLHLIIVHGKNKLQHIRNVLSWGSLDIVIAPLLVDAQRPGLLTGGQGWNAAHPWFCGFLVEFAEQWKELPAERQKELLQDPWAFKSFTTSIDFRSDLIKPVPNRTRAQQEGLLHLVFPDTFEAIVAADAKRRIANTFSEYITEPTDDVDQKLQQIRPNLETKHGISSHLFYRGPVKSQWDGTGPPPPPPPPPSDGLEALADELLLPVDFLKEAQALLEDKKQVIFQGPPGTGKTYVARALAKHLADGDDGRVTLVQFHPSYAYEDFVQGFRPKSDGQGFELRDGPLRRAAEAAEKDKDKDIKHFLVIDEINRGNLGKVFGELYFLLEYRDEEIQLQYSDKSFKMPKNLYIIGTMNTADRSIALVDLALRRRFAFVEFRPDKEPISKVLGLWLQDNAPDLAWVAGVVDQANKKLKERDADNADAAVGPSYFMKPSGLKEQDVPRIWEHEVMPYIRERLYGRNEQLAEFQLDALRKADSGEGIPVLDGAEHGNGNVNG